MRFKLKMVFCYNESMHNQNTLNHRKDVDVEKIALKITNFDLASNPLSIHQVRWLIVSAMKILKQQSTVLHLSAPIKIIGDILGHYEQLKKIIQTVGSPAHKNYLFLGNYVSKGPNSIESLVTLLFFKIKYPKTFFLLRGRFELPEDNFIFGFHDECVKKYGKQKWFQFNELFAYLPLAAVIEKQVFCMSSGLTPTIKTIAQMKNIIRNPEMTEIPEIIEFLSLKPNKQGTQLKSHKEFKSETFFDWLRDNKLGLVIRSNQVLEQGFQFGMKNKLLTICSVPHLLKVQILGAVVNISQDLLVSLQILKSSKK